jgi:c-di-GMP-binding flagellar brake protein YcgR
MTTTLPSVPPLPVPPGLPSPQARLVLRHDDAAWPSRLEGVDAGALTVARPFDLPIDGGPVAGADVEVTWTTDGGAYTLPSRLVETVRDGIVALWVLAPTGTVTRAQRRAHFRLALDAEARVSGADSPDPVTAHLVDVSEAGVRLRLEPEHAQRFPEGAALTAAFGIREERFEVAGTVLRGRPSRRTTGGPATDLVVCLDLPEAQARDLRRALMAEQVRRRRLARD